MRGSQKLKGQNLIRVGGGENTGCRIGVSKRRRIFQAVLLGSRLETLAGNWGGFGFDVAAGSLFLVGESRTCSILLGMK